MRGGSRRVAPCASESRGMIHAMSMAESGGDRARTSDVFVVPAGATWFAVEKLVQVRAPTEKDGDGEPDSTAYRTVEKWKTQWIAHPSEEGVKVNKTPIPAGTDLDAAQVRQGIAETWGFGFYRLRWSTGGRTSPFEIVDPAKTEAPPPGLGGRVKGGRGMGSVSFEGGDAVAAPVDGLALLPPEIRQFMAMQTVMASLTRGEEARRAEQDRKQFELLLRVVDNRGAAPAQGGLDARDLKIALLETVAPLREEISALKLDNARMRRAIEERPDDDDEDDIDWDEPLGAILGKEVKKGIVEVAGEITPEVVPFLKEAIPAMFAHLKSRMAEEKAKALAKAAGGVQ